MKEETNKEAIFKEALERIANPIRYMMIDAEAKGCALDGNAAVSIAKDPHYLMQIAKDALQS
jgi:hypothetical protein